MYEITFIVKDEKNSKIVKDILTENKAKILYEEEIGKKNFCYTIKKQTAGYYFTYYVDMLPAKIASVTKQLNSEAEVLRFLTFKSNQDIENIKNKKVISSEEVEEKEKVETKEDKKTETKKETKEKKKTIKKETKAKTKKETAKKDIKTTEKPKQKIEKDSDDQERIKKLEEKLDELLKE